MVQQHQQWNKKSKKDKEPPNGQKEGVSKPAITNVSRKPTFKEQLEEIRIVETSVDVSKKERNSKNEVKEEPYELTHTKDKEQANFKEKDIEAEKILAEEAKASAPNVN